MKARLEAAHRPQIQRQKIEKQGAVGLRRQRDHLAFGFVVGLVEHVLQIGGLAAEAGAVIHDFAVDFARGEINKAHIQELSAPSPICNSRLLERAGGYSTRRQIIKENGLRSYITRSSQAVQVAPRWSSAKVFTEYLAECAHRCGGSG